MRVTLVCLLSLALAAAAAAAPAPFSKDRDGDRFPSAEAVKQQLIDRSGLSVASIEQRTKREWVVVGYPRLHYRGRSSPRSQKTYLVKFQGTDDAGRPQLTLIDLEAARSGGVVVRAHTD